MTRSTLILALVTSACVTSALAQTSSPPRNDMPQPYRFVAECFSQSACAWLAVKGAPAQAGLACCSMYSLMIDDRAPPHETTRAGVGIAILWPNTMDV
jgi:hypothetical protein